MLLDNAHKEGGLQVNIFNSKVPKRIHEFQYQRDLTMQAKQNSINLSKALEQRLVEMLLELKRCKWREDNKKAIDASIVEWKHQEFSVVS